MGDDLETGDSRHRLSGRGASGVQPTADRRLGNASSATPAAANRTKRKYNGPPHPMSATARRNA